MNKDKSVTFFEIIGFGLEVILSIVSMPFRFFAIIAEILS